MNEKKIIILVRNQIRRNQIQSIKLAFCEILKAKTIQISRNTT
ncbi:hypothetical protein M2326_000964 [Flavobacterium sp. 7A]|nr:hypothetical protein [Flavobacterium sp. 7A]